MTQISDNLSRVKHDIHTLETRYNRIEDSVNLLAVSKTKPIEAIIEAYEAGQRLFGENYVQEAVSKYGELQNYPGIVWHFIGPIQSNKSRQIAETMDWVHTVDREKIARRLSEQRPISKPPLNVLIQVNISQESSKSGIALSELGEMVDLVNSLPNIVLRGLMAIPAPQESEAAQIDVYRPLTEAYEALVEAFLHVDTLSIGMSGDLPAAIASKSSLVRVGTSIFGARDYSTSN
ncbi:YggS family pyridoxal phosphate-dependent enzyme [Marinomonas mediterranea]|jgi:pyridoxal phosphate enzyme, YggS family|uniref:Pyridoxal phosphate homeostasis protein n=1 Tax=Marinomonas mediterranea (strain ATCC 700492 / JCM 21426 / NBRC 103028 / MMB-1) TaxID=717774 RepID=F2JW22_MARM1|nr:YggS family pyridoxal phosphate-dependent enzyme [Marinomonas mediterranea]ADZ92910.1 protein of unknown function UPF0001 [Marinomonas mediterranea MMB-1]WCN18933.1 YggS family pyridoxal phosphate-dependent enzyme [Marinomonas mediterranea MMB-1]